MGFRRAVLPAQNAARLEHAAGMELVPVDRLIIALGEL